MKDTNETAGIRVTKYHAGELGCDNRKMIVEVEGDAALARFRELVQRGANLWPDAHPEIKEFADKVTVGHVQQNYYEQATDKHK